MRTNLANWCLKKAGAMVALSALLLTATLAHAEDTFQDPSSKTSFPKQVSFDIDGTKHTLEATGASTRIKFFVKVYAVASYVENPVKTNLDALVNQILDGNPARQFTIHWLRDAEAEKVKSGFVEGLQKTTTAAEFSSFQDAIKSYLVAYEESIKANDIIVLRWLPSGKLQVYRNDKLKAEITNNAFARAVWNVTVGPNSAVKRAEMFSLIFPAK